MKYNEEIRLPHYPSGFRSRMRPSSIISLFLAVDLCDFLLASFLLSPLSWTPPFPSYGSLEATPLPSFGSLEAPPLPFLRFPGSPSPPLLLFPRRPSPPLLWFLLSLPLPSPSLLPPKQASRCLRLCVPSSDLRFWMSRIPQTGRVLFMISLMILFIQWIHLRFVKAAMESDGMANI